MSKKIAEEVAAMGKKERKEFLTDNAYKVANGKFFKKYDDEELLVLKETFTEKSIQLGDKSSEFAEIKADYTGQIKKMSAETANVLSAIRSKGEWKEGDTYMFDDQKEGNMYTYDEDGNLIEKRRLRPDEKQSSVLTVARDMKA